MKTTNLVMMTVTLSLLSVPAAFAKNDATGSKLLSSCKSAIKEYCVDVKNKKDAKAIFDCLEAHESNLKSEKEHKACAKAHEDYETAHGINESGEAEHK